MCTIVGILGGGVSALFGGWSRALEALLICMAADYLTGLILAGVFHASPKSAGGGLESLAGWKGLARKFVTLLIVLVANQMDHAMGMSYIRDAVIIGFCANECISILENAGLMGLPIPKVIRDAVDLLRERSEQPQ
jgi:toxin secretion/phage lysis holin